MKQPTNNSSPTSRSARVPVGFYSKMVEANGTVHECFVTCISASGLYFDSVSVPTELIGATIRLSLGLPTREEPLELMGLVVGEVDGEVFQESAVRFLSMSKHTEDALKEWVHQRYVSIQSTMHAA